MKHLIFIVAYNHENFIEKVLERLPKSIFLENYEILIVDDASIDKTFEIAKNWSKNNKKIKIRTLKNIKNYGYGGNQKIGMQYAIKYNFDNLNLLHGDGQYAPEELPNFIERFNDGKFDAIFGSRMKSYKSALKGGMPFYKFLGNIGLTFIQNIILGSKISEFHSGYRTFKVSSLKKIEFEDKADYYHFDTEIIIEFLKKKFNILEIHIPTHYGDEVSHLKSIPYGLKVLWTTIKSKF